MGGSRGTLTSNPGLPNFQDSKTSSQSRQMYNKENNNHQLFIYGPQLSSHLYQSTYKIWKQSDKDFLGYHENDEVSADAAAADRRLNHGIPRTYFIRGIQLAQYNTIMVWYIQGYLPLEHFYFMYTHVGHQKNIKCARLFQHYHGQKTVTSQLERNHPAEIMQWVETKHVTSVP